MSNSAFPSGSEPDNDSGSFSRDSTPSGNSFSGGGLAFQRRLASEGALTLELLVRERVKMERTTVQRMFHQTLERHEGALPADWWQIFTESASALQLRPAVLDCSVDQVLRLINDGADVVLFDIGDEARARSLDKASSVRPTSDRDGEEGSIAQWILLSHDAKGRALFWESSRNEYKTINSARRLRSRLSQMTEDERIRCVAFDWREVSIQATNSSGPPMKPIARVVQLLRPEWSDIWLVIVFAFVVGLFSLATPIAVESLVNTVAFGNYLQPVLVLSLILLLFLSLSAAIMTLETYVVEIIQQRLFARIAGDLAHRLPRVATEENEGKYLPELTNRFFDVVSVQKISASLLLDGVTLIMSMSIGMVVLGFYHPFLLGFDALLLSAIVFLIVVLGRGAVKTAVKESKSKYYMAAWLEDVARCQSTFHTASGKRLAASRSDRLVHDYLINRKKHFRVLLRQVIFALSLQAIASTVLLGLGGYLVVIRELTLGQLVAAELIVAVIVGAFAKMGKHFESFYDLLASVDKLGALFDLPLASQGGTLHCGSDEPMKIELDRVTYSRKGKKPAFAPLTATLPPASSTAIIGPAGSGKSTLLDLIYGSRRPTAGIVEINGSQPSELQSDDFWNHVEIVRDGEVFASTIDENIHVQRTYVSGLEVENALKAVGLDKTINSLPEGVQTHLTSSGAPLASNQVRLLLLARAIAERPNLLLIDGVLDSLSDDEAESILEYLLRDDHGWTLVIATGRRWIAERCDHSIQLPLSTVAQTLATN
ncbi:ATP-binding cassette domain-containing protein [Neorhodopirellula pilleata]|uniref:Putative multidrug export ATP-binding/permease protein n=1 Tax=Neorhodopirellula pilleata TaxID=2714738 RepID=A0A5C6AS26_9BACT|nr:ABC transporter ATP-binding protein [Neorhodopirellula pilleata]TWU01782.1 putative multidrug export ATP-binding/permease protein [Neorhodopirellula pilleata]